MIFRISILSSFISVCASSTAASFRRKMKTFSIKTITAIASCVAMVTYMTSYIFRDTHVIKSDYSKTLSAPSTRDPRKENLEEEELDQDNVRIERVAPHPNMSLTGNPSSNYSYISAYHARKLNNHRKVYWGECYSGQRPLPSAILRQNNCQKRLPKAFVVGIKKSGTMTLCQFLGIHPAVSVRCEVQQLMAPVKEFRRGLTLASSRQLQMVEKPGTICKDVEILESLKEHYLDSDPKFLVIIRDPVVRAVSDYIHKLFVVARKRKKDIRDLHFPIKFKEDILYASFERTVVNDSTYQHINSSQMLVRFGMYSECFETFLTVFKRERLLILDGQAFAQNPFETMQSIERFLELPPFFRKEHFRINTDTGYFCPHVQERPEKGCSNPRIKGRKHPTVNGDILKLLYDFYRPYNLKLAEEFGLDFPWLFQ